MAPSMDKVRVIPLTSYKSTGSYSRIFVAEQPMDIPFTIRRLYWISSGEKVSEHGNHAHLNPEQILVAVLGTTWVEVTDRNGLVREFQLDCPETGLFIPPAHWLRVRLDIRSTLLCLSSHAYEEQETVSNLNEFLSAR